MHSKYDNMHRNGMNYALKYTNNHAISRINCMSSTYKMEKSCFRRQISDMIMGVR